MDAGDLDGDAAPDVVLGNYARRSPYREGNSTGSSAYVPLVAPESQPR